MKPASLDWVQVVQDLFLEGASAARIAAWLDGTVGTGDNFIVVRAMRAIDGFDATIAVRGDRARSFSVWYRDLEKPTLADAEALFGPPTYQQRRLFDLVFHDATRTLEDGDPLVVSCSASGAGLPSTERRLAGIALTVLPRRG